MHTRLIAVFAMFLFCLSQADTLLGQEKTPIAPAEVLKPGWEEIDQRLLFLMVRLANVEASLDAVDGAIAKSAGKRVSSQGAAKRAERGNELMDRKAGGPMVWSEFYGRTAERFFYHPVDANSTYHTRTILLQRPASQDDRPSEGVPSRQGLPTHQRPPQFDYIYRANRDAQARAERDVAELGRKVDALTARRRTLEDEQSDLWCQIAFRAAARHDLARKPLLRFEPTVAGATTADQQRAEALRAAATFLATSLSIIDEAQKDQPRAFANIKTVIGDGRRALDDSWVRQVGIAAELSAPGDPASQFAALAKRLEDVANNLSDSYEVANEGDMAKDLQRKETFRALLQESLVDYAEIVLALNEMVVQMASEWKATPDVQRPLIVNVSFALPALHSTRKADQASTIERTTPNPKAARSNISLKQRLAGTKWINTSEFIFEWDADGNLWHRKGDVRTRCNCVFLGADRARVTFINNITHILVFDEDLTEFKQYQDGEFRQSAHRLTDASSASPASLTNRQAGASRRADNNDANPLLGDWVAIAEEVRGVAKTTAEMRLLDKHLFFRPDSVNLAYTTEARRAFRGRYDIISGGANGAVDLHLPAFTRAGKDALVKAIYEVDGNTLKICWTTTIIDEPEKPRPTSFQTSPVDGAVSTIFKRASN